MQFVITGGTGFVGRQLVSHLLAQDHHLTVLTRDATRASRTLGTSPLLTCVTYDPLRPKDWSSVLDGVDGVINLVGESLTGGRWTPKKKAEIRRSRIEGTTALVKGIEAVAQKPRVLVSGSAVGYYGPQDSDRVLDETAQAGADFLAQLSVEWEAAALPVQDLGVRLTWVRTGIVLGPDGGALAQLLGPFQAFIGGPLGSGHQWLSWIHRQDLVRLIEFLLTQESCTGPYNGTAPNPVQMEEFCNTLGQVIGRPSWLPVPALALELLLGEAAQVVLTGQRVIPSRAESAGFSFAFPQLKPALEQILV